jgi:hypothetical protein
VEGPRLTAQVAVSNLSGHKFPTAYPSRRAWLHVTVRDGAGATVFESGAFRPDGSVSGNDMDEDALRFEPHHGLIERQRPARPFPDPAPITAGSGCVPLTAAL